MSRVPTALESERAVVAALLDFPDTAEVVLAELKPEDFYDDACRKLVGLFTEAVSRGGTLSWAAVADVLSVSSDELSKLLGGRRGAVRAELAGAITEVRRTSQLRQFYTACKTSLASLRKTSTVEEALQTLETSLYRLSNGTGDGQVRAASDTLQTVVNGFLERFEGGGIPEVSTGIKSLDRAILGLRPGKVLVLAGRPGMGKTALADSIRRGVLQQGYGVIQFSLEMSAEEILEREVAFRSGVSLRSVMSGSRERVSQDESDRVRDVVLSGRAEAGDFRRWFIDDSTYGIDGIRRRASLLHNRMARDGVRTGLVVLDYIQLAGDNGDGREQAVAAISRGCKLLAKQLGCTVVAISQLNRNCEGREDKRPLMCDLRESGAIEQDADIVAFLYRENVYNSDYPIEEAELLIRKHRSGPVGAVKLRFMPEVVAFGD